MNTIIVDTRVQAVNAVRQVQEYLNADASPDGLRRAMDDLLKDGNKYRADVERVLAEALEHPYNPKTCGDRTRVAYGLNPYGVDMLSNAWKWFLLAVQYG